MIKETNLVRLPILNENYEPLEYEIINIVYSIENYHILGFNLNTLNSEKQKKVLLFKKVKDITEKGILIYSQNDIVNVDELNEMKDMFNNHKPVIGYEIYLNNDQIIGVVKDTLLQISSGRILGFIISEGVFDDLINGYSFLPLDEGIDLDEYKIILKDEEELKILPQVGGLKKMLGIDKEN